jgi:hypothetical protein
MAEKAGRAVVIPGLLIAAVALDERRFKRR